MEPWGEMGYCSSKEAWVVCKILSNGNTEENTKIHSKGWQIYCIRAQFFGHEILLARPIGHAKTGAQNQSEPSNEKQLQTYFLFFIIT